MKTTFLILLAVITNLLYSQPADTSPGSFSNTQQPPKIVMTGFSGSNPHVNALWIANDDNTYSAEFRDENTKMGRIIIYDNRGNLLAVQNELHDGAYPVAIEIFYAKNYPQEKFTVWSHYDDSDHKTYFINREQEALWFDRDGRFVEVVKKKNILISRKS